MFNLNRLNKILLPIAVVVACFTYAAAQVDNPGTQQSGSVTVNNCVKWGPGAGQVQDAGAVCNNFTPAAATQTNDTNVTLTLTGTPATALLQTVGFQMGWTGTLAAGRLNANVVQAITNDTNITGSITAQNLTLGWAGTLAAARLNANVVQAFTNDTNVTASITAQNATLGWTGTLAIARGGTGAGTQSAALSNIMPTPTRAGDIVFWNGSIWTNLAGNNSGTQVLSENASGVPAWSAAGTGTMTQITPSNGLVSSVTAACSQTAITTSGTLFTAQCLNAQTGASYAIADSDRAKLITASNSGAQAYSIAQAGTGSAFVQGWYTEIKNIGTGTVTVTPTTSTINGTTSIPVGPGEYVKIVSDGTNYQASGTAATLNAVTPANQTAITGTSNVMLGLGAAASPCTITPKMTGKVLIMVDYEVSNSAGENLTAQLRTGTGAAPANGAAATGTQVGANIGTALSANSGVFDHASRIVTGLAIGTAVWIDLSFANGTSSTTTITGATCNAVEIL